MSCCCDLHLIKYVSLSLSCSSFRRFFAYFLFCLFFTRFTVLSLFVVLLLLYRSALPGHVAWFDSISSPTDKRFDLSFSFHLFFQLASLFLRFNPPNVHALFCYIIGLQLSAFTTCIVKISPSLKQYLSLSLAGSLFFFLSRLPVFLAIVRATLFGVIIQLFVAMEARKSMFLYLL